MAARKKAAKKAAKKVKAKKTKKTIRKAASRKPAAKRAKTVAKKAKTAPRKPAKKAKKTAKREYGEGNYKASKRFRTQEEAFIKANRSKIAGMGKAAEEALDGPEGKDLLAAEAEAASHAAGGEGHA